MSRTTGGVGRCGAVVSCRYCFRQRSRWSFLVAISISASQTVPWPLLCAIYIDSCICFIDRLVNNHEIWRCLSWCRLFQIFAESSNRSIALFTLARRDPISWSCVSNFWNFHKQYVLCRFNYCNKPDVVGLLQRLLFEKLAHETEFPLYRKAISSSSTATSALSAIIVIQTGRPWG